MGAWGHGLLQNDDTQDALVALLDGVGDDVFNLRDRPPDEAVAARVGAAVGVLLQLCAVYWLAEDNEDWPPLRAVLERQRPAFDRLPPGAARILGEVVAGKGSELAGRAGPPDERLARALYGEGREGFPMERPFGLREPALFEHPEAARYVQEVADRLVKQADKGFDHHDVAGQFDDGEGGEALVAVAVLLVLAPCRVDPDRFASWRARVRASLAACGDPGEPFFECLESAFALGIERFSAC